LFQMNNFAAAKVEFQKLTEMRKDLAPAYYFLGICHDRLGEYLDAMANYQSFLRLADPKVSQLEIDKVNLRMPILQRHIKNKEEKRNELTYLPRFTGGEPVGHTLYLHRFRVLVHCGCGVTCLCAG